MAQERRLQGQVLKVGDHDETIPVEGVDVVIKESGDSDRTKAHGLFRIFLKDLFAAGEKVSLIIDLRDWRIQYPLDGETLIPADLERESIEVRLLPVGSRKWLSNEQIEIFIRGMVDKAKEQVAPTPQRQPIDLSRYIKEWAVTYGFSVGQVKAEIDKWVAEVDEYDPYKRGLADFAKKKFLDAAERFNESAERKEKEIEQLTEKIDRKTDEAIRDFRLAGDSYYNSYEFDKALEAYERALRRVSRAERPLLSAVITVETARANEEIGIRTEGPAVYSYLAAAERAYRNAQSIYTRAQLPQQWATTQNNLGNTLHQQGIRTGGDEGRRLLADAVTAYRAALEVHTRAQLPQDWAVNDHLKFPPVRSREIPPSRR